MEIISKNRIYNNMFINYIWIWKFILYSSLTCKKLCLLITDNNQVIIGLNLLAKLMSFLLFDLQTSKQLAVILDTRNDQILINQHTWILTSLLEKHLNCQQIYSSLRQLYFVFSNINWFEEVRCPYNRCPFIVSCQSLKRYDQRFLSKGLNLKRIDDGGSK